MRIQRFDPEQLSRAYDIWCQSIQPWEGLAKPPFGASFALARPGEQTKRHAHQDGEAFLILRGCGTIRAGEEIAEVRAGDVVYLPPFSEHTLANDSPEEDLLFVSIYWEDLAAWTARLAPAPAPRGLRAMVTAAPPTPNGDLHLGHLSGPYLAADIHARYLRARGLDAHYVCGTDDNQSYVATRAEQLGLSPMETADRMAEAIALTLEAARAELALFVRPNASPTHASMVHDFFRRLHERGKIVARETDCAYCERCERFLVEAYIRGRCPHCGAGASGGSCEDCGRPNDGIDLLDAACARCGAAPARRRATRLFFPLGEHAAALAEYHRRVAMPPHLRALCEQVIAAGLPDIAITQPSDWGIPVPLAGFEAQRLYVWFEMAPRYLAYAESLGAALGTPGGWERVWKDDEARVVQCFGFDNGFFYAVLVPALLLSYDPEIRLASAFLMNEFYRLDGLKFSTSRRHAIWGRELLARVTADQARFYLAYTCPEVEGTNFTLEEFAAVVDRELGGPLQAWLGELAARVSREAGGAAPAPGDWTAEHRRFHERLAELVGEAAAAYEAVTFSPQRAARVICDLLREVRRFAAAEEHWARIPGRKEERRTAIALELLAARALCMLAAPIMPDFAERLRQALGSPGGARGGWEERPTWVTPGQAIGDLGALVFPSARCALAAPAQAAA